MSIEKLKSAKSEIAIPAELDRVVKSQIHPKPSQQRLRIAAGLTAVAILGLNALPAVALNLRQNNLAAPVIDFLTLSRFAETDTELGLEIDVTVPDLTALGEIGEELSAKYQAIAQAQYDAYLADYEGATPAKPMYKYVGSKYDFIQLNSDAIVVRNYTTVIMGSGIELRSYDVVDLQLQRVLLWEDLLKPSANEKIREYLWSYISSHPKHFFVEYLDGSQILEFRSDFFINRDSELVISFDEYQIAPGSEGVVTISIPTEIISEDILRTDLIK